MQSRPRPLGALLAVVALLVAVPAAGAAVGPGRVLRTSIGQCTFNFLFDGTDGARYIGSAGHCILDTGSGPVGGGDAGERSWAPGAGPIAKDGAGQRIGQFVYAILQDPKDFSLIRLDPGVAATPQMPTWGGPIGVYNDTSAATRVLQYYGQGIAVSAVAPARQALAFGTPDPDHIFAWGLVTPGDSGGGIETDNGLAAGVIVTIGINTSSIGSSGIDAGPVGITRLPPQLARAQQVLGLGLAMRTAPLLNGGGQVVAPSTGSGPTTPVPTPASGTTTGAPARMSPVPVKHRPHKKKRTKRAKRGHKRVAKRPKNRR